MYLRPDFLYLTKIFPKADFQSLVSTCYNPSGFPGGAGGKESICQYRKREFDPWVGKIPGGAWQPTPVFLPGTSHGQRSLTGYSS